MSCLCNPDWACFVHLDFQDVLTTSLELGVEMSGDLSDLSMSRRADGMVSHHHFRDKTAKALSGEACSAGADSPLVVYSTCILYSDKWNEWTGQLILSNDWPACFSCEWIVWPKLIWPFGGSEFVSYERTNERTNERKTTTCELELSSERKSA